ncbi:hypothetical protein MNBD_ALPHA04-2168 [hydrothermal vent metagenome]|uniref:Uncharacterized protein n=1 Tax=hydrothermal vent metagenome TaxID=652676 RepID=A0A3B0SN49_9ZZZZ
MVRNIITMIVGNEARKRGKGSGILGFGVGILATRIATRSLPGAMLVGGAMIAKALYDRAQREDDKIPAADQVIEIEGQPIPKKKPST